MSILDQLFATELKVVEVTESDKTWIGGIIQYIFKGDPDVEFVRRIRKSDISSREVKTVTLRETNGSYHPRYWTQLPPFWDNHAVVSDDPETVFKYERCSDVIDDRDILNTWMEFEAEEFWDDGFTEYEPGEFNARCSQSIEKWNERTFEMPFEDWYKGVKNGPCIISGYYDDDPCTEVEEEVADFDDAMRHARIMNEEGGYAEVTDAAGITYDP